MPALPPDWQNTFDAYNAAVTRRQFFRKTGTGLGVAALASLLGERAFAANAPSAAATLTTCVFMSCFSSTIAAPTVACVP